MAEATRRPALLALMISLAAGLLAACRPNTPAGPVTVSVIGAAETPRVGLVRLDGTGQVLPALALRWAILEDGRDYLFRIDDAPGQPSAASISRRLRDILVRRRPRHDATAILDAGIAAVTPTVVELRLEQPRPDLLQILALPPFDFEAKRGDRRIIVHAEPPGRAVARFRAGAAAFVTGGTFADLPVAQVAGLDPERIRFDPATGLFGFAPVDGSRYADPDLLRALDLALDRPAMVDDIGAPGLVAGAPRLGAGANATMDQRIAAASGLVAKQTTALPPLRVAMPNGAGARRLFAHAAADWRRIGVQAQQVAPDAPADLVLVDRVAPFASVGLLACAVSAGCDPRDPAARAAPPFLAIATPVRWSLVASELAGFTANPLAAHPLDGLRLQR